MTKNKKYAAKRFVVFAGGETAGPIMPLLALAEHWQTKDPQIVPIFFDIKRSVASRVVPNRGYEFRPMTAGKFRRYWSFRNLASPFQIFWGVLRSIYLLSAIRPIAVIGAGGYVQVPVMVAAWLLRIPRVIHQQDIVPTYSNKLCAPLAQKITTAFQKSTKDFHQGSGLEKNYSAITKIDWTGNPCALQEIPRAEALKVFDLKDDWPTVLVIGGGSGAMGLNQAVAHNLPDLLKTAQVIHSAGRGKMITPHLDSPELHDRYRQYEFIDRTDAAYSAADVVIARAGVGTITELSVLSKASIIVPMPQSHQEGNALYLFQRKAALVVDQMDITPDLLARVVKKILFDPKLKKNLETGIHALMPANAEEKMLAAIQIIL